MQSQAIRPMAKARRWLTRIALVAVLLVLGTAASAPHAQAAGQIQFTPGVSAAELVRPDGTLDLTKGVSAVVDLRGWDVTVEPALGPVLAPETLGWNALGKGMIGGEVRALAVSGSDVYVGGIFTTVTNANNSTVTVNNIAKWNGSTWSALGKGVTGGIAGGAVQSIAVSGSDIYVGGWFETATNADDSAVTANRVAKWNGSSSTWSPLGQGVDDGVYAVGVSGSDVYVGGGFYWARNANGSTVWSNHVARWDGSTWSALGKGVPGGDAYVHAFAVSGSDVYVGGRFTTVTNANNSTVTVKHVARWDGSTWFALGQGLNDDVYALAASGSDVYAGGIFTTATNADTSTVTVNKVAKWDGLNWSRLGQGMDSSVFALAVSGSDVYVGGYFTTATNADNSTVTVHKVAKRNGSTWSALGQGVNNSEVEALAVSGSDVYVGGDFTTATNADNSTVTVNKVARYGETKTSTTYLPLILR